MKFNKIKNLLLVALACMLAGNSCYGMGFFRRQKSKTDIEKKEEPPKHTQGFFSRVKEKIKEQQEIHKDKKERSSEKEKITREVRQEIKKREDRPERRREAASDAYSAARQKEFDFERVKAKRRVLEEVDLKKRPDDEALKQKLAEQKRKEQEAEYLMEAAFARANREHGQQQKLVPFEDQDKPYARWINDRLVGLTPNERIKEAEREVSRVESTRKKMNEESDLLRKQRDERFGELPKKTQEQVTKLELKEYRLETAFDESRKQTRRELKKLSESIDEKVKAGNITLAQKNSLKKMLEQDKVNEEIKTENATYDEIHNKISRLKNTQAETSKKEMQLEKEISELKAQVNEVDPTFFSDNEAFKKKISSFKEPTNEINEQYNIAKISLAETKKSQEQKTPWKNFLTKPKKEVVKAKKLKPQLKLKKEVIKEPVDEIKPSEPEFVKVKPRSRKAASIRVGKKAPKPDDVVTLKSRQERLERLKKDRNAAEVKLKEIGQEKIDFELENKTIPNSVLTRERRLRKEVRALKKLEKEQISWFQKQKSTKQQETKLGKIVKKPSRLRSQKIPLGPGPKSKRTTKKIAVGKLEAQIRKQQEERDSLANQIQAARKLPNEERDRKQEREMGERIGKLDNALSKNKRRKELLELPLDQAQARLKKVSAERKMYEEDLKQNRAIVKELDGQIKTLEREQRSAQRALDEKQGPIKDELNEIDQKLRVASDQLTNAYMSDDRAFKAQRKPLEKEIRKLRERESKLKDKLNNTGSEEIQKLASVENELSPLRERKSSIEKKNIDTSQKILKRKMNEETVIKTILEDRKELEK